MTQGFGIDIGGSGIKGAVVDVATGQLAGERLRLPTPQPATVPAVLDTVVSLVAQAGWGGPVGCTFPGIVRHGRINSAANVDDGWIGTDLAAELTARLRQPVVVRNDADAAGIAEMRFGAGRGSGGVVLVATLGTGIGSAMFTEGVLMPNTELGHLELAGYNAEGRASNAARERDDLSLKEWARKRLQPYFTHVERLFSPDLIIIGGGVSKKSEKFLPLLDLQAEVVPAGLLNQSGIVGAAAESAQLA